jgi:hypothetical protein
MRALTLTGMLAGITLATATGATPALAKCTVIPAIGNIQPFQCDSDNQATDADDLKFFINKATGVTNVDGSLNKNTSNTTFENIRIKTDAAVNQEGNGFAELHSANAGSHTLNTLHTVEFDPIGGSMLDLKSPIPFLGFDGFFGRGQVDALFPTTVHNKTTYTWDGDVFLDIKFVGGATQTLEFTGDTKQDDFGAIGFDEINEPGALIDSVTMRLDATGAFNEVKQFDFSVPGATAAVPEPSTWAMLIIGFGLMGLGAVKHSRRQPSLS